MQFPSSLSAQRVDFIAAFYAVSDDSSSEAVEKYLTFLTEDCDFIMGLASMKGHGAVREMRKTMWGGVATRRHVPEQVFIGKDENDLMLYGTVDYGLRNGSKVDKVGWAARMVFVDDRMQRYQVWLDGTPLKNALQAQS